MLTEVSKEAAVMAALNGVLTYRITDYGKESEVIGTINLTKSIQKLIDIDCARYLADLPDEEQEKPTADECEEKEYED